MAEDYTYTPVTDVTALAARVHELEAALSAQCGLTAQLIEQRGGLERENAGLTREVAGLRYYIGQLERNVTQEERAYAAGVASLMVSQAVQP